MPRFDGFVLFAEMRTGSNFLEETINLFPGLQCHGEAFNPSLLGQHDWTDLLGMDRAARDADPLELLRRIIGRTDGLGGFRFFHDHDPRVLDAVLPDPRIAKVVLSRNPLDAYVSHKIAQATDQWRLTDERHRKVAKIRFNAEEFEDRLSQHRAFQSRLRRALQRSGQTAFELDYEETGQLDVINGLAAFLGERHRLDALSTRLKRQNPAPLSEKVENFAEMQTALAKMGISGLTRTGASEPRHAAAVPNYVAGAETPLLFMPVKGGPTEAVSAWLAALDGVEPTELVSGFTQQSLRQWKNHNKDGRSFTVVIHPALRAHTVFLRHILRTGPENFAAIRESLRTDDGLPIPPGTPDTGYGPADHRAAFLGYLDFVRRNLAGQTRLRTDPAFATQSSLIQSMAEVIAPDLVIRGDQLDLGLAQICQQVGMRQMPPPPDTTDLVDPVLRQIYDDEIETAVRRAYNRDYTAFGFRGWRAE